jgi:hypothetical protein
LKAGASKLAAMLVVKYLKKWHNPKTQTKARTYKDKTKAWTL